jgi:hypothetical protein
VRIYKNSPPGLVPLRKWSHYYLQVNVTDDQGRSSKQNIHTLITLAFLGERTKGHVVRHLDGNPDNNHISNLAYGTPTDNVRDAMRHGTQVKGSRVHGAILSELQVTEIKLALLETPDNYVVIAKRYGVTKHTIYEICRGSQWKHVEPSVDLLPLRPKGTTLAAKARFRKDAGLVDPTGGTRKTVSGRHERLWRAT